MADKLASKVDEAIDRCIRTFSPDDPGSFVRCDSELSGLEGQLRSDSEALFLLQRVRAHRIFLFSEVDRHQEVLQHSDSYLRDVEHASSLDLSNVVVARIRSLHILGSHDAEVKEALRFAAMPLIDDSSLLTLLEPVMRRHPGVIRPDSALHQKAKRAEQGLRSSGYPNLPEMPVNTVDFEKWLLEAARQYRQANRDRAATVLSEPQR